MKKPHKEESSIAPYLIVLYLLLGGIGLVYWFITPGDFYWRQPVQMVAAAIAALPIGIYFLAMQGTGVDNRRAGTNTPWLNTLIMSAVIYLFAGYYPIKAAAMAFTQFRGEHSTITAPIAQLHWEHHHRNNSSSMIGGSTTYFATLPELPAQIPEAANTVVISDAQYHRAHPGDIARFALAQSPLGKLVQLTQINAP